MRIKSVWFLLIIFGFTISANSALSVEREILEPTPQHAAPKIAQLGSLKKLINRVKSTVQSIPQADDTSTSECTKLAPEQLTQCKPADYLGKCLRSQQAAAQNRDFCEAYAASACSRACRATDEDQAAMAKLNDNAGSRPNPIVSKPVSGSPPSKVTSENSRRTDAMVSRGDPFFSAMTPKRKAEDQAISKNQKSAVEGILAGEQGILPEGSPATLATTGSWFASSSTNASTGDQLGIAKSPADNAGKISLRCDRNGPQYLYLIFEIRGILNPFGFDRPGKLPFAFNVDGGRPLAVVGEYSDKAIWVYDLGAGTEGGELLAALRKGKSATFYIPNYKGEVVPRVFALTNAKVALETAARSCGAPLR